MLPFPIKRDGRPWEEKDKLPLKNIHFRIN